MEGISRFCLETEDIVSPEIQHRRDQATGRRVLRSLEGYFSMLWLCSTLASESFVLKESTYFRQSLALKKCQKPEDGDL